MKETSGLIKIANLPIFQVIKINCWNVNGEVLTSSRFYTMTYPEVGHCFQAIPIVMAVSS